MSCLLVLSPLTGKKVKCRKADSRSERSGSSGGKRGVGGSSLGPGGASATEGPLACHVFPVKPVAIEPLYAFLSHLCFHSPTCKSCKSELPSSGKGEKWCGSGSRTGGSRKRSH